MNNNEKDLPLSSNPIFIQYLFNHITKDVSDMIDNRIEILCPVILATGKISKEDIRREIIEQLNNQQKSTDMEFKNNEMSDDFKKYVNGFSSTEITEGKEPIFCVNLPFKIREIVIANAAAIGIPVEEFIVRLVDDFNSRTSSTDLVIGEIEPQMAGKTINIYMTADSNVIIK